MIPAPRVNINGTSKEELIKQYDACLNALGQVVNAMRLATPHGRDYQTMEDGAYSNAVGEWGTRIRTISKLADEIEQLQLDVFNQE